MPNRAKRPCNHIGCLELVDGGTGYCDKHKDDKKVALRVQDKKRGSAADRGYDATWRKYRAAYLKNNPLCIVCMKEGIYRPATVVDHIKPHKGNMGLFWDTKNHQPMCKHHHDIKTSSDDGGFGNDKG